ncbi:uncharacterized protein LOC117118244 [Anneissia japonica]|uniref:uncharacterized protein LOC117118244 n=1 Tax=Anneissia japonica TaxID=1529436 RepID=UPI0014255784|nr:uncharacterized protein LOC117118244 [Anneissia japonica]
MKAHNDTNANEDGALRVMPKERGSLVGVSCIIRQYEESRFIVTIPGLPILPYQKHIGLHQSQNMHDKSLQATRGSSNHGYNLRSSRKHPKLPPKPAVKKHQQKLTDIQDAKNGNFAELHQEYFTGSTAIKPPQNCILTEQFLLRIAEQLGNEWQSLLIHLGLKKSQIDLIKSETLHGGDLQQTIFRGLLKWKQRCRREDEAIHQLRSCLQQVGRNDISQVLNTFEINGNHSNPFQNQNTVTLQEKVEDLEKRVSSLENRECNCSMKTTDTTDGGEEFEILTIEEVGLAKNHCYGNQQVRNSLQDWVECGLQRMTTWSYSVGRVHEEETMEF